MMLELSIVLGRWCIYVDGYVILFVVMCKYEDIRILYVFILSYFLWINF